MKKFVRLGFLLLVAVMAVALVAGCAKSQSNEGEQAKSFGKKIIGIDPGAGLMSKTEEALKEYGIDYELVEGSGATMTAALKDAIEKKEWIVVTGWSPHWKFAKWDLKYLEDPKKVYGEEENINTVVRKGLKEDMPDVYEFLDKFYWTPDDMNAVMVMNADGMDPAESAKKWVAENEAKVNKWLPKNVVSKGKTVKIGYVEWDTEIASTNVVKEVLESKMGLKVDIIPVSASAMWQGLGAGEVDGIVAAWLPTTHGHYLEKVKDKVEDLGPNLEGTRIGLVVPSYVTIDSIEDLKNIK